MKSIKLGVSLCGFVCMAAFSSEALAQVANTVSDARDFEALAFLPTNTVAPVAYFREASTSYKQSFSQSQGVFGGAYILKFGQLALIPFDILLPVVDATVYGVPVPTAPGTTATLHTSGVGDLSYLPTLEYIIPEDEATHTHTYVGVTAYVTAPTGNHDTATLVNIGDARWRVQPQIEVGQRFLKALTLDLVGGVAFYTDNKDFGLGFGQGVTTLKQNQTFSFEAHLAGDLSPTFYLALSYYLAAIGERNIVTPKGLFTIDAEQTVQTLRYTFGIHIEKQSLLLLQYQQDVAGSGDASLARFIGAKFTHVFFL